ncbi:MAG TPA: NAD-dependent epimerase/dehydratase family protein [Bryobacteraceae bacterium]|nr:NAD-dependent epimerase/dehydratase family protein [Bryobacteraceae bacterium]
MSDVLILGCGFTGRRLDARLRARGCNVTGTTRRTLDLEKPGALDALRSMVTPGMRVLHSVPTLPDGLDREAVAALEGAARIVYISTTAVYGDAEFVDENTPAAPVTDAARARLETECAVQRGPWSSLILRPAAIYGPGRGVHASLRASDAVVSRIHVDDLAAHAEAALFSDLTGAWPVADEYPCPSTEILEFLGVGRTPGSATGPPARHPRTNRRVDGRAIRRELGISLRYPTFREGVAASVPAEPRIFLAEDNPADVYLIREALRQHGLDCRLDTATNGEDAVRYLRSIGQTAAPHLLLLDFNLPRAARGELLDECRRNPACARIPLIVLSSAEIDEELPQSSVFFRKPPELDAFLDLGALVRRLLAWELD